MILGIVQARLGSTRLPRKVLRPLLGKPMILRIAERVESSRYVEKIAVATTSYPEDADIEEFAKQNGLGFYRGSELNIAERLYETGKKYGADTIVRVWGDCPLVDPSVMDSVIEKFFSEKADYATNVHPPSFPRGLDLEVYKLSALKRTVDETSDPFYLEYPREYMIAPANGFTVANVSNPKDLSDHHWTVDYPEDFEFAEKVYERLYPAKGVFSMEDVLSLIERDPKIGEMEERNKKLRRNIEYFQALEERKK